MPFLALADAEIFYEVAGDGRPFLFNAATAWDGEAWKLYQVAEFSRDHTVITYDQRGTGKSKTKGADFSTRRLTQDVVALLDHLQIGRAITLGHSNGGRIAVALATEYPSRVDSLILASAGTTYNGPPGVPVKMCVELVEKGYEQYMRDHIFNVGFTPAYYAANKEICDGFLDVRMSHLPPLENFLGHVVGRQSSDLSSRLEDIKVPTLVMIGEDESHHAAALTHREAAELLARKIPGAKLVMLRGQGHHYPFVAPQLTNGLIREFLAAVAQDRRMRRGDG